MSQTATPTATEPKASPASSTSSTAALRKQNKQLRVVVTVLGLYTLWSVFGSTIMSIGDKIEQMYPTATVTMVQVPVHTPGAPAK